tara:strand:- start:2521 stop:3234 length:714 start_codon:yes stop_codon:yes gene_type:complete
MSLNRSASTTQSHQQKSALIVWGGWEGHFPKECTNIFGPWLENQGYKVEVSDTLESYLDTEKLKSLNLIVPIWTQGEISKNQESNLLNAVANGVGIAGWHGSMGDSFRMSTNYQFMVGGQWVSHPGSFIEYEVNIIDKNDPITNGLSDFKMFSEQYYMHVDPSNEVLATTKFTGDQQISDIAPYTCDWIKGCVMPVAWKRRWGKGKVFYSSLGHKLDDFEIPEVLEITKRGMIWASR